MGKCPVCKNNIETVKKILKKIKQEYGLKEYNFLGNNWVQYDEKQSSEESLDKTPFEIIKNEDGCSLEIRFFEINKKIVFELLIKYRTKYEEIKITSCNVLITIEDKINLQFSKDFNIKLKNNCEKLEDIYSIIHEVVTFVKERKYGKCW